MAPSRHRLAMLKALTERLLGSWKAQAQRYLSSALRKTGPEQLENSREEDGTPGSQQTLAGG